MQTRKILFQIVCYLWKVICSNLPLSIPSFCYLFTFYNNSAWNSIKEVGEIILFFSFELFVWNMQSYLFISLKNTGKDMHKCRKWVLDIMILSANSDFIHFAYYLWKQYFFSIKLSVTNAWKLHCKIPNFHFSLSIPQLHLYDLLRV